MSQLTIYDTAARRAAFSIFRRLSHLYIGGYAFMPVLAYHRYNGKVGRSIFTLKLRGSGFPNLTRSGSAFQINHKLLIVPRQDCPNIRGGIIRIRINIEVKIARAVVKGSENFKIIVI